MKDYGQNSRSWFYYQALFSNSSDCFQIWEKKYVNRVKLTAQSIQAFYLNLIHQRNMNMNFSQSILYTTMQEVHYYSQFLKITMMSLIILELRTSPLIFLHLLCGQQINAYSLALKKAETTRNTFVKVFFFITVYLIIIDN